VRVPRTGDAGVYCTGTVNITLKLLGSDVSNFKIVSRSEKTLQATILGCEKCEKGSRGLMVLLESYSVKCSRLLDSDKVVTPTVHA
jgi:hypothetical protein